jgi:hypothetical protein
MGTDRTETGKLPGHVAIPVDHAAIAAIRNLARGQVERAAYRRGPLGK